MATKSGFSRRLEEASLAGITVDVHLYGALSRFGGEAAVPGFANLKAHLPEGSVIRCLLACLGMPGEERGITFINGQLSAMPGLQADLEHVLNDHDRVAFFDVRSVWPFQYRQGITMADEMSRALSTEKDGGIHNSYDRGSQG